MFEFLRLMWLGTLEAMRLNPQAFAYVQAVPGSGWVVLAIAVLGGASLLLGQSVILFLNRVTPRRFALSLLLNGVVFTLELAIWAFAIWLTGRVMFPNAIPFLTVLKLVGLGAAPYVFGFLVLLPYAGSFIARVLGVWSLLVVLGALTSLAGGNFGAALACTLVGWLIVMAMSATIGRPIVGARNWVWRRLTGADKSADVKELLTRITEEQPPSPR